MQRMARDCRDAPARAAMKRAKAFNVGLPRRFRRPRHNRVTERGLCWRLAGQILVDSPAIPTCRRLEQETRGRAPKLRATERLRACATTDPRARICHRRATAAPQCRQNTGIGWSEREPRATRSQSRKPAAWGVSVAHLRHFRPLPLRRSVNRPTSRGDCAIALYWR
jgi:hypothetical protein